MSDEIVNRVSQSKLITLDLEDHYPEGQRIFLDISVWLFEGFILREKEFRASLDAHDWERYNNSYVALGCTTDAIVPGWAYMLVSTKLQPFVKKAVIGDLELLETYIFQSVVAQMDLDAFKDKPVIIKGCGKKPIPPNAYIWAVSRIQSVAKSVMYGEACSSVPLYKKK